MSYFIPQNRPVLTVTLSPGPEWEHRDLQRNPLDLDALAKQFPTVRILPGSSESRLVLGARSEADLERVCRHIDRLQDITWGGGPPSVVYLETIRKPAEAEGKYIRQTGGSANYAHCKIRLAPSASGADYTFVNEMPTGAIPDRFIEPIDQVIQQALEGGILRGFPIVGLTATLLDGSAHETDSNEMAFRVAAVIATRGALCKANPVVMEPMAEVLTECPEGYCRLVLPDLNTRRARIQSMEHNFGLTEIRAILPLAETLGEFRQFSSVMPGLVRSIRFLHYEPTSSGDPGAETASVITSTPSGPQPRHRKAAAPLKFDPEPTHEFPKPASLDQT